MKWLIKAMGGVPKDEMPSIQGHGIHINLPPSDRKAILRHLCRLDRCRHAASKADIGAGRRQELNVEIHRHASLLSLAGIEVPTGDLSKLIEEYS